MDCVRNAAVAILAAFLLADSAGLGAQQPNPLYEHRQAVRSPSLQAAVAIKASALTAGAQGRVVLNISSSSLLSAGIRSGDPVRIDLPSGPLLARAAFRDEIERNAAYQTASGELFAIDAGVTLIVDRNDPSAHVVIDSTVGQSSMYLDVVPGQSLTVHLPLSLPDGRRAG
jgi:hypothetical protein